jgi:hypothetical protein
MRPQPHQSHIGLGKVHYSNLTHPNPQSSSDVVLISGSFAYIRKHSQAATNPMLVLCKDHIRGKVSKFGGTFRWFHLQHASFGGSTLFKAFLGTNIGTFQPELTKLRRTIAHILDHGIRPTVRHVSFKEAIPATRLLHPSGLQNEVIYRSSFTSTGWGSRSLSVDELGMAIGFPSWLRRSLMLASFPVVPIQILDGCLRGILPQITARQTLPTITLAAPVVESHQTWLPSLQKFLPHSWINTSVVTSKAAKRDDAAAPTHLWDARFLLVMPHVARGLPLLGRRLMRRTAYSLFKEFSVFMGEHYGPGWAAALSLLRYNNIQDRIPLQWKRTRGVEEELSKYLDGELLRDAEVGWDAIGRFANADWWNWKMGSTLIFWCWSEGNSKRFARDGMEIYITARLPRNRKPSRPPPYEKRKLILDKIKKVLQRGYVGIPNAMNYIKSLIDFFEVPKNDDICLVYIGTSCGLKEVLYAPNFWLPTPASAARVLGYGYYMVDIDLGEMFFELSLAFRTTEILRHRRFYI